METTPSAGSSSIAHGPAENIDPCGSNTQNYALVWMAPLKDFAVLVMTNQGGDKAAKACNDAATALIQFQQREPGGGASFREHSGISWDCRYSTFCLIYCANFKFQRIEAGCPP